MRFLVFGIAAWVLDGVQRVVPRTYRLPDGAVVKRGMTRAEVEARLGGGDEDAKNRTRLVDLEIWFYRERTIRARFRQGKLRSITESAAR